LKLIGSAIGLKTQNKVLWSTDGWRRGDMKVTEEKAWAAWNKIQEDGPDLDFESFWEILKEVFEGEMTLERNSG
jgi:hypothetical protein